LNQGRQRHAEKIIASPVSIRGKAIPYHASSQHFSLGSSHICLKQQRQPVSSRTHASSSRLYARAIWQLTNALKSIKS